MNDGSEEEGEETQESPACGKISAAAELIPIQVVPVTSLPREVPVEIETVLLPSRRYSQEPTISSSSDSRDKEHIEYLHHTYNASELRGVRELLERYLH